MEVVMLVPGEIVARHHTSLGEVIIRYPQSGDAAAMMEYINHMSLERTFITLQGEQKTLEEEEQWLRGILDGMANHQKLFLVAAIENRIVGIAGVSLQGLVEAHVGELGI